MRTGLLLFVMSGLLSAASAVNARLTLQHQSQKGTVEVETPAVLLAKEGENSLMVFIPDKRTSKYDPHSVATRLGIPDHSPHLLNIGVVFSLQFANASSRQIVLDVLAKKGQKEFVRSRLPSGNTEHLGQLRGLYLNWDKPTEVLFQFDHKVLSLADLTAVSESSAAAPRALIINPASKAITRRQRLATATTSFCTLLTGWLSGR